MTVTLCHMLSKWSEPISFLIGYFSRCGKQYYLYYVITQFILGHFYLYKYQWNNEGTVSCVAVYSESLCQFLRERKLTNVKLYIFFTLKSWQRK